MEIVRAFNANALHTEITIKGSIENPLFRASDIGIVLDIANMRTSIIEFDESEKVVHTMDTPGGNQQVTFLTEKGLYKVLFRSRKPIAHQFQNWACEVIKEIRLTGQYKLNKEVEELKQQLEEKQDELQKNDHSHFLGAHRKFLQLFHNSKVVYIVLLKYADTTDKKYIIKIGKTENMGRRIREIAAEYMVKEPLIFDIYESNNILQLENRIHTHVFMKNLKYNYTTIHDKIATETYCVSDNELKGLKTIIKELQDTLPDSLDQQIRLAELQLKNNELLVQLSENKLKISENQLKTLELYNKNSNTKDDTIYNTIVQEIKDESKETKDAQIKVRPRCVKSTNNPEIYQYTPDLTLIKKYNSQIELQREKPNISLNSLRNAIKNNTIYLDYRWVSAKRNEAPEIKPTKKTVIKSHDVAKYIVRLNDDKTKILNVYASAREGIEDMKCILQINTTLHSFDRAIKTGGLQFGYYWNHFDKCSIEMQNEYLSHSSLPSYVHPNGITILKICPHTGSTLESFHSKVEIFKKCGISTAKLNKILNTNEIYQDHHWITKGVAKGAINSATEATTLTPSSDL
jgi:prophage antirepressor-like protein